MAESVSKKVREIVDRTPFLRDVLRKGFLNYTNFTESILEEVSQACNKEVKETAVIMALRRYATELNKVEGQKTSDGVCYTIVMHTNIIDYNYTKTPDLISHLGNLYDLSVRNGGTDFLNVILGSNEVTIATSEKLAPHIEKVLSPFKPMYKQDDLVALTMSFGSNFIQTPGIVYEAARRLAWNSINVYEIVSTISELTFVIKRTDSFEAYRVLQNLQGKK